MRASYLFGITIIFLAQGFEKLQIHLWLRRSGFSFALAAASCSCRRALNFADCRFSTIKEHQPFVSLHDMYNGNCMIETNSDPVTYCKEVGEVLEGNAWCRTPEYKAAAGTIWPGHPPSAELFLQKAEVQQIRCVTASRAVRKMFFQLNWVLWLKMKMEGKSMKTTPSSVFCCVLKPNLPFANRNMVQQLRIVSFSLEKDSNQSGLHLHLIENSTQLSKQNL